MLLDPNFMYFWDREHWSEWYALARGEFGGRSYNLLAERYRYGVCTWDFKHLRWIVEHDPRMEIVAENAGAYVFRIDRDHPEIPLDRFLYLSSDPWELVQDAAPPSEEEETVED